MITDAFIEYFRKAPRQGPGSECTTKLAAGFIENIGRDLNILDVGCGAGRQTIQLAKYLRCNITALDFFPAMLDEFNSRVHEADLCTCIKSVRGSMDNMPFQDEEFDLIWSEGAIFIMGFKNGIKEWRKFVKKGGYIAVTDASWLTTTRPDEINNYWNNCYPDIDSISNNINAIEEAGYIPVASFVLPEDCWIENYYLPLMKHDEEFLKRHNYSEDAKAVVNETSEEYRMYTIYKDYYSYVFYIMKKI
jgi:ubiquinone/menaquinone biosynthesis C-methylase UbiE